MYNSTFISVVFHDTSCMSVISTTLADTEMTGCTRNTKYQIRNQTLRRGNFCLVKSTFLLSLDVLESASEYDLALPKNIRAPYVNGC